jgi:hypothetical protein
MDLHCIGCHLGGSVQQAPLAEHQEELTHLTALGQVAAAFIAGAILPVKTKVVVEVHGCISFLFLSDAIIANVSFQNIQRKFCFLPYFCMNN